VDEGTLLRRGMKEVEDIWRQNGWERIEKKRENEIKTRKE
jgi:hypothetical protein